MLLKHVLSKQRKTAKPLLIACIISSKNLKLHVRVTLKQSEDMI